MHDREADLSPDGPDDEGGIVRSSSPLLEPLDFEPPPPALRITSGLAGIATGAFAVSAALGRVGVPPSGGETFTFLFRMVFVLVPAAVTAMLLWFALRGDDPRSRTAMRSGCAGGAAFGGIGLLLGLVGPLLLLPDANLGPLIGIFVTGPLGAVLGTVVGSVRGRIQDSE